MLEYHKRELIYIVAYVYVCVCGGGGGGGGRGCIGPKRPTKIGRNDPP